MWKTEDVENNIEGVPTSVAKLNAEEEVGDQDIINIILCPSSSYFLKEWQLSTADSASRDFFPSELLDHKL